MKRALPIGGRHVRWIVPVVCLALGVLVSRSAAALDPGQLLLIANRNMPESVELAKFYAQQRNVPDGRIVELDLPVGEEISFEQYEQSVVPALRSLLRDEKLQNRIACLVTFYGVPIKIGPRPGSSAHPAEATEVTSERKRVMGVITHSLARLEAMAVKVEPGFTPQTRGDDLESLGRRVEQVGARLALAVQREKDPQTRQNLLNELGQIQRELNAVVIPASRPASQPASQSASQPATAAATAPATGPVQSQEQVLRRLLELEERRFDPASREALRDLAREKLGPMGYARVLEVQSDYVDPPTEDGPDAFDNELCLIGWPSYLHTRWRPNSLFYNFLSNRLPPIVLVSRIDGPTPEVAKKLIVDSIAAEKTGLSGKVVLDAQGLRLRLGSGPQDPKAAYDQRIRDLAKLLKEKTKLDVFLDDAPQVLQPGAEENVAVYCGWYSLANYVPGCKFVTGAVGYHVASFEMTTLRDPANHAWVKSLLADGVVATFGPVAEPYLHAFPYPDDFISLLLTGKLSLAEVFWLTNPLTSWKMSLVGDPLYTPYKANPAIRVEDLPRRLSAILAPQVVGPTTGQGAKK